MIEISKSTDELVVAINKYISNLVDNGFMPSDIILDEQLLTQLLRECSYNYGIFTDIEINNLKAIYSILANKYGVSNTFNISTIKTMNIPTEQTANYYRILRMFANYGIDIIKDCGAVCTSKNKNAVFLFNLFVSGVVATEIGNTAAANVIFAQVTQTLSLMNN